MKDNYSPNPNYTGKVKTKIILKDDTPIYENPRRLSVKEKTIVENQIDEWLKDKVIEPSCSEFASCVVLVKKKDDSTRLCIDFRKINKKMIRDRFPFPLIEDQIDQLQGAIIFSTIDLKNSFFHVPVEVDSRRFTSFVTHNGQWQFRKTPFGLANSGSNFVRFVTDVFRELVNQKVVLIYMDDLIIPSLSEEEGLKKLEIVLKTAANHGLIINWKKCQFLQRKVKYLGYIIEDGKVRISTDKILAIKNFPAMKNAKQIQCFLGLTGYFRKFIPNYAIIAKPLSDLLKDGVVFRIGPLQNSAIELLKKALAEDPVLKIYDPNLKTELHTYASKYGYGAVMLQVNEEDSKLHPIYYMSKKTTPAEENYSSYELEVLAIINAVKKFRVYLLGIPFKIITDCSAFQKTMEKRELITRVARWALALEEYEFVVEHRAGTRMRHADALSRFPIMTITSGLIPRLEAAQCDDDRIVAIRKIIEKEPYQDYVMHNELLCKYISGRTVVVVPANMKKEIVRVVHDNGHFAAAKMEEIINQDYYISNLKEVILKCIRNCIQCILAERKRGKKEGFLRPIPKEYNPLNTYHIDHLGPMELTSKQYKYVFAIIDGFSKFVWLYATKTTGTKEVLAKLMTQQQTFGNPERIITDRGTAFTSNDFVQYCEDEKINLQHITTGIPRGNGQIERTHQIIISLLTKMSADDPSKWYKHLERAQRCINGTFQRSIGKTPFEVLLGVKMKQREDVEIMDFINKEIQINFEDEREIVRAEAMAQIARVQEEQKRTFDKNRKKSRIYKNGSLVGIKRTQFGAGLKIKSKFLGPYKVLKMSAGDRYDVIKVGNFEGPKKTSSSADNMKPWAEAESSGSDDN